MLVQAVQNTPTDKHTGKVQLIHIILILADALRIGVSRMESWEQGPLQALLIPVLDINTRLRSRGTSRLDVCKQTCFLLMHTPFYSWGMQGGRCRMILSMVDIERCLRRSSERGWLSNHYLHEPKNNLKKDDSEENINEI